MKNLKVLFCALFVFTFGAFSFSQIQVSYTVDHATDAPSTPNGCSRVQLEVVYNTGGSNISQLSSWQQIDQGVGVSMMVTIPSGATIVEKKINFSFTLSSNTYSYTITDSGNWQDNMFVNCSCPTTASKVLSIQEIWTRTTKKVVYHLTSPLGGC